MTDRVFSILSSILFAVTPLFAEAWYHLLPNEDVRIMRYNPFTQTYWLGTDSHGLLKMEGQLTEHVDLRLPDGSELKSITSLALDASRHIVWVGTTRGLFRYRTVDGTWQFYDSFSGLVDDEIKALLVDSRGHLWYGTDSGIGKLDEVGRHRYNRQGHAIWDSTAGIWTTLDTHGPASNLILCITEDHAGDLYFGTAEGLVVFRVTEERWEYVINFISTPDQAYVRAIAIDRLHNKWLGTDDGVCTLDSLGQFKCYKESDGLVQKNVHTIWIENYSNGDFKWFGTNGGISALDSTNRRWQTFTNENTRGGLAANEVRNLIGDDDGNIWVATLSLRGVSRLNNNWSELRAPDDVPSNFTYQVERDQLGRLWIATDQAHFQFFQNGVKIPVSLRDAWCEEDAGVTDFLPEENGMWVASTCGIHRHSLRGQSNPAFRVSNNRMPEFPDSFVRCLAVRNDTLWAGTDENGIVRILVQENGVVIDKHFDAELPYREIRALAFDSRGHLWAGAFEGLMIYDGNDWRAISIPGFAPNEPINALAQNLVVAPSGAGRAKRREDSNDPRSVLDPQGWMPEGTTTNMWVGTSAGIARFDGAAWTKFTRADGLPDERITALKVNSAGVVWCTTLAGVAEFKGDRWEAFTARDGLSDNQVNDLAFGPEGIVWFGTFGGGVSRYRRTNVQPNTLIIDPFSLATQSSVLFNFTGYDLNTPTQDLRYQYKLDDQSWSLITFDTRVAVQVETAGEHVFTVRAIDADGNADPTPAIVRFHYLPSHVGGNAQLPDSSVKTFGSVSLYVPPNSLAPDLRLYCRPLALDSTTAPEGFTGIAYELGPAEILIPQNRPVSLTLSYGEAYGTNSNGSFSLSSGIDERRLRFKYFESPNLWLDLGGTVDAERNSITVSLVRLDTLALVIDEGARSPENVRGAITTLTAQPRILSPHGGGFNDQLLVSYQLSEPAFVTAKIYNVAGRLVRVLCDNVFRNQGSNVETWDGTNRDGETCVTGLYIVTVEAGRQVEHKTVMIANKGF